MPVCIMEKLEIFLPPQSHSPYLATVNPGITVNFSQYIINYTVSYNCQTGVNESSFKPNARITFTFYFLATSCT